MLVSWRSRSCCCSSAAPRGRGRGAPPGSGSQTGARWTQLPPERKVQLGSFFIFCVTHVGSLASGSPNWRQHLVRSLFSIDGHIFLKMILGHTRFSTNQVSFYLFSFPRKKKSSEDEDEDDEDDGEDDPGDDPYPLLQATNALGGDYGLRDLKLE